MRGLAERRFTPFDRRSLGLAFILVILPNALFLATMPFYIAERLLSPLLYLAAGLLALALPRWTAWPLFLGAAVIDLGLIVAIAFHLPIATAVDSLRFMATIDPAASAFYIFIAAAVAASALLAAWLTIRHRSSLRGASPTPAALLAFALVLLDYKVNLPYTETGTAAPFESAVGKAGLTADAVAGQGHNLLIVMVEGMGAFAEPRDRALVSRSLERLASRGGYDYETGTTLYSGSTTAAESRELCGRRADYLHYLTPGDYDCLPRRLAGRGYDTVAYHGFTAQMFSRDAWYPRIGFARSHFEPDIRRDHPAMVPSHCGSVFDGLCDDELARVVRAELLAPSDRPKLVYWLTLNSHIPFVPKQGGRLDCLSDAPRIDNETVCQLSGYWADIFDRVAAIAADPALPPTDILLVGDHHTPLWERSAKSKFRLGEVDWFLLRHKPRPPL